MGIEKIGLPVKPAAKGSTWVLDASSCQTCQTPFSLFNRKHHCRRCGGLFCGNCSSSKVILRSQGDSPVRVCEPCKKLEEAARFQLRHRGKQNKGALKGSSVAENESLVRDALGDHGIESLVSCGSDLTPEVSPSKDKAVEPKGENTTPEKLRDQALEEKRIYATLKREGRNAEALQAFKRHKELTREADALDLSLKKAAISQRKALAEATASTDGPVQKPNKESPDSAKVAGRPSTAPEKLSSRDSATGRKANSDGADDDLLDALKDLGWKEADLSEKKVKKAPTSDMDLLAEISDSLPKEASTKKPAKQNPTQLEILAHKRQALALKREGKPAEAKEELKKAKMLERKLEEMALLEDEDEGEDDDNDELAILMRSLNKEAKMGTGKDPSFPPGGGDIPPLSFSLAEDDDDDDPNVDVTDDDVNDPSIIAALQSMGWEEDAATMERSRDPKTGGPESVHIAGSINNESSLQSEILTHKRRVLALKREGKVAEAKVELQEAKVLEQKLEALKSQPIRSQSTSSAAAPTSKGRGAPPKGTGGMRLEDVVEDIDDEVEVDEDDMRDPEMMAALKAMGFEEEDPLPPVQAVVKPSPLEKKNLQDEILSIKRSALALKRQGKTVEAREELRNAKHLEQKLEKMQKDLEANALPPVATRAKKSQREAQVPLPDLFAAGVVSEDEEEEVEVSVDDFMDPDLMSALKSVGWQEEDTFVKDKEPEQEEHTPAQPAPIQQPYKAVKLPPNDQARKSQLQKDLLAHKRRALALKREGKSEEAKSELAQGKVLEKEMEAIDNAAMNAGKDHPPNQSIPAVPNPLGDQSHEDEDVKEPEKEENTPAQPAPIQQPYKAVKLPPKDQARKSQLQKELLAHKRRALALKREGKSEEARSELAAGKVIEKEMEEIENAAMNADKDPPQPKQSIPAVPNPLGDQSDEDEDVTDEDMRDPELLNALKAFGWKPEPEKTPVLKDESPLPPPPKVEKAKLDVTNPLYTKAVTEPEPEYVDPIWHAIMKSASIGHNQVPDTVTEKPEREHSPLGDHSVEGEHGEIGSSTDFLPPLFDHPSSGPEPPKAVSGEVPSFDLLSGGALDAAPAENVSEKDDSEDEDDVFDPGLLAALQSIGLGPPPKRSSSVQLQGDAANVKTQDNKQNIQQTRSPESRRGQQNDSIAPDRTTSAEPKESSATSSGRVGAVGRVPVPQPARSVSRDDDADNHASAANAGGETAPSLQEEIKMHKRKALALKREGKNNEAREELRRAKILEKQLETGPQSSTEEHQSPDGVSKTGSAVSSTSSPEKPIQTLSPDKPSQAIPSQHKLTHKDQVRQELRQGKDRKKLQQESLAHKRKALGLRREGKIDEADAEFELAKTFEKQMEDLDQQMGKAVAQEDMGMVDDLLDPQLMAALKGLGFNDGDLQGGANVNRVSAGPSSVNKSNQQPHPQAGQSSTNRPPNMGAASVQQKNTVETSHGSQSREGRSSSTASPSSRVKEERTPNGSSQPSASQAQRKQLEDQIKREKVQALELKRAGRHGEALEVLRGAKRLEKELQAMAS